MTDRELMQQALDALDSDNPDIQLRAATHLRAALAQPEQEPVAWELNEVILDSIHDSSEVVAPPQREWVGLTDEEMLMIYGQNHEGKKYSLGRMVQQALKEKNT